MAVAVLGYDLIIFSIKYVLYIAFMQIINMIYVYNFYVRTLFKNLEKQFSSIYEHEHIEVYQFVLIAAGV